MRFSCATVDLEYACGIFRNLLRPGPQLINPCQMVTLHHTVPTLIDIKCCKYQKINMKKKNAQQVVKSGAVVIISKMTAFSLLQSVKKIMQRASILRAFLGEMLWKRRLANKVAYAFWMFSFSLCLRLIAWLHITTALSHSKHINYAATAVKYKYGATLYAFDWWLFGRRFIHWIDSRSALQCRVPAFILPSNKPSSTNILNETPSGK